MTENPLDLFVEHHTRGEGAVSFTGYDECVIGIGRRFDEDPMLVYDERRLLARLMADGMSADDAREWMVVNMLGISVGPQMPIILAPFVPEDWRDDGDADV